MSCAEKRGIWYDTHTKMPTNTPEAITVIGEAAPKIGGERAKRGREYDGTRVEKEQRNNHPHTY